MIDAYVKPNAPFALSVPKGLMSDESNPSLRSGRTGQRPWQTVKARGKPSKDVQPTRGAQLAFNFARMLSRGALNPAPTATLLAAKLRETQIYQFAILSEKERFND